MDYEISMKELKEIDSVAAEAYYNIPLCDGVHDRFTLKHYCTMSRGVVNKRYLSYVKIMETQIGYGLLNIFYAIDRVYRLG